MNPKVRSSEKKRRKKRKRQKTAAAKAELAGKPPPVRRKSFSRIVLPVLPSPPPSPSSPPPSPSSASGVSEMIDEMLPEGVSRWEVVDPTASDTSIDTPDRAPDASGPGELVSDATEDIYSVPLNIFQTVSFLLKFPDAGTGQSESLKQFLMQEYHEQSAEDIGQMAEDIRQNRRSSELLRLALRYGRASDHARQTIKETMQSMTINCECDGFCRTAGHKAKCECGSRDSVRRGCILGPSDLDHAPGSEGHEGQTQERHDAEDLGYWLTEECLPCCQLPAAWWNAWWRENQMLVQGLVGTRAGKSKLVPAEGTPPPPISGCEWLNRYATDKQKFLPPFELALAVPAVVFQCQSRCRCQAICHPCHLNVTRFRPLVVGRAAANAEAAGLTVEFFESKGFEDYTCSEMIDEEVREENLL